MTTAVDTWLENYYGRPPSPAESAGALQNLLGFVTLLKKADKEDPPDDGSDLV